MGSAGLASPRLVMYKRRDKRLFPLFLAFCLLVTLWSLMAQFPFILSVWGTFVRLLRCWIPVMACWCSDMMSRSPPPAAAVVVFCHHFYQEHGVITTTITPCHHHYRHPHHDHHHHYVTIATKTPSSIITGCIPITTDTT